MYRSGTILLACGGITEEEVMSQEERTNCIGRAFRSEVGIFLILIIFIFSLSVNKSEAG